MKKGRTAGNIFCLCAVVFYVIALFCFLGDGSTSQGIFWMLLGSAWLCIGSAMKVKSKARDNGDNNKGPD